MPEFLKGLGSRLALSIAAACIAVGMALGGAAPASADVTIIEVTVVIVEGGNGYVQPQQDVCRTRYGPEYGPWGDRGCARGNGYDYVDLIQAGLQLLGGGQFYCPGQFQATYHDGYRYEQPRPERRDDWYPVSYNQQFGGLPPAPNLPPAQPIYGSQYSYEFVG